MKTKISKKVKKYEEDGIFIVETKGKINYSDQNDEEEAEKEEIRRSGIKKKVNADNYFPDPCECGDCMNYDEKMIYAKRIISSFIMIPMKAE